MNTNMEITKVVAKKPPSHCGYCEFGFDNGWLDNPPENTCILMNEPLDDIVNQVILPDFCPIVESDEHEVLIRALFDFIKQANKDMGVNYYSLKAKARKIGILIKQYETEKEKLK